MNLRTGSLRSQTIYRSLAELKKKEKEMAKFTNQQWTGIIKTDTK